MTEQWARIPGLGDKYEISDQGRVRTLPYAARYTHGRTGQEMFRRTKEKILAQQKQNSGYWIVHLWHEDKRIAKTVHRLVAQAFCLGFRTGAEVNHTDGVKDNNRADNLEWMTRTENHLHAVGIGLNPTAVPVVDPSTGVRYDSIAQAAKGSHHSHRYVSANFIKVMA